MNLSVVCPLYNESQIIGTTVARMIDYLAGFDQPWELILVNDGSTDDSLSIVTKASEAEPRVKIVSYSQNQGRGFALKAGIDAAAGDVIVTTEVDMSWGEDIVTRLYDVLQQKPELDFVVASPNLSQGGYHNVPPRRVLVSKLGNKLLRLLFSFEFSMYTGMTRAYRRSVIQPLSFREKGKEFHLEVLLKLGALGFAGIEIPAKLEWSDHKMSKTPGQRRKSSSKIGKLILSHLHFAVFANPLRYFWALAGLNIFVGSGFCLFGLWRFISGQVSIYSILLGVLLLVFGIIFFGFGIVTAQNRFIIEELWMHTHQQRHQKTKDTSGVGKR